MEQDMEKVIDDLENRTWTVTEEQHRQTFHDCLDTILDKCIISEIDGEWLHKECKSLVYVDWFEKTLICEGCGDL